MSELMREALRRYDQTQASASPAMSEVLTLLRSAARAQGLSRMSKRDIDKVITETRNEMRPEKRPLKRTANK